MSFYGNGKQSIPQRFLDKMKVDAEIESIKRSPVVSLEGWRKLRYLQWQLRVSCENFIRDQKTVNPQGPSFA